MYETVELGENQGKMGGFLIKLSTYHLAIMSKLPHLCSKKSDL